MSAEKLQDNARQFIDKVNEGLKDLTNEQRQIFMNGVFLALNSYFTLASPVELTPFQQEVFMSSARSNVYNKTGHLGLDDSLMQSEMKSSALGLAEHYRRGVALQLYIGPPLSEDELMQFDILTSAYHSIAAEL